MSMVSARRNWLNGLKIAISSVLVLWSNLTLAQATPDTTLGSENSVVAPDVEIRGLVSDRIDGGARRGANLFHSFQEFNVREGRGVYFTNPQGIENILSRVTGANRSEILGRLGVLGNANLFLINPNGIVFGQNASLDVEGSFVATTANAIRLGETGLFSATDPASSNLLSINPSALFYNVLAKEAAIVNRSQEGLSVLDGRSLLLVGGKVALESGVIKAPGGRIELGGLDAPGTVAFSQDGNNLGLSFPEGVGRADVLLTKSSSSSNGSEVNVRAGGKGSIAINARDVEISGGSALRGGIEPRLGSVGAVAGDITLNATGTIEVKQLGSVIENSVGTGAIGNAGNIEITAGALSVKDGAQILARTYGQGNAGGITIDAREAVSFDDGDALSTVEAGGEGNAGDIKITSGSLSLMNGGQLLASVRSAFDNKPAGIGNGGNTLINVRDALTISGVSGKRSGIFNRLESGTTGSAGNINITTGSLSMIGNAQLSASTFGKGNAGSVNITATNAIKFDGKDKDGNSSGAFSQVNSGAEGKAGGVTISTGSLDLTNGAVISASTFGTGDAGGITIDAREAVSFNDGDAFSTVGAGAVGDAGDLKITAGSLSLINGSQLGAFVRAGSGGKPAGIGNAGNTIINVRDALTISGVSGKFSGIINGLESGATGSAGDINIITGSLSITGNARLSASTSGKGNAGGITIDAREAVTFNDGDAFSTVAAGAVGDAGDLKITAGSLSLINGSQLGAFVRAGSGGKPAGIGNAGNTIINVRDALTISGVSGKFSGIIMD